MISVKVSGKFPSSADLRRTVEAEFQKSAQNVAKKLGQVVATSDGLDVFVKRNGDVLAGGSIVVGVNGERWPLLVRGTRDHFVKPRTAKVLAFPSGHVRKTIPNQFASREGGPSGPIIFSKGHQVKGMEPGNWPTIAAEEERPEIKRSMSRAVGRLCKG